jgi:secondary thiamine-phosphate synthase enzyme
MEIITEHIKVATGGNSEVVDITKEVEAVLKRSGIKEGQLTVFVVGSTAAVTTTEFEPGLQKDIPEMLERIAPSGQRYHHDETWGDGNGHAHIRASFIGPSLTVPCSDGRMLLGTWQQIVLIDFDNRSRRRDIIVQLAGESRQ